SRTHIAHLASAVPHLRWQPSDRDELDVARAPWPVATAAIAALLSCHLAQLIDDAGRATMFREAARVLVPGGPFFVLGGCAEAGSRAVEPAYDALRGTPFWREQRVPARIELLAQAAGAGFTTVGADDAPLIVLRAPR